jgi:hypothetical protein
VQREDGTERSNAVDFILNRTPRHRKIGEAIRLYRIECDKAKAALKRAEAQALVIEAFAQCVWLERMAAQGVPESAPVRLVNAAGEVAVYTVQDKTGSHDFKPETLEELGGLVGADVMNDWVAERSLFTFNPVLLAKQVVQGRRKPQLLAAIVGERLIVLTRELVRDGLLSEIEAKELVVHKRARSLKRGFLRTLPGLCGSVETLSAVVAAMGAALVRYLKPG